MKIYNRLTEDLNELEAFYENFAEYVGANEKLDINRFSTYLKSYIKNYECVRYWQEFSNSITNKFLKGEINSISVKSRKYFPCARGLKNIQEMIEEDEIIELGLITSHKGKGVSVVQVLTNGIKESNINKSLVKFMQEVLIHNKHQDEIIYFNSISSINKNNVIAYFNEDDNMIIPL